MAQWLRIRLPMQGTWVQSLVQEDPTCRGATKSVHHSYWACALEPMNPQLLNPCATATEACAPRARAPQQEKPPQWEACTPQWRVARARGNWRKPKPSNEDPTQPKKPTKKHQHFIVKCYVQMLYKMLGKLSNMVHILENFVFVFEWRRQTCFK